MLNEMKIHCKVLRKKLWNDLTFKRIILVAVLRIAHKEEMIEVK